MTSFQAVHSQEHIAEVASLAREIWQEYYVPIIGQKQVDYMLEKFQSEKAVLEQLRESYEYYIVNKNNADSIAWYSRMGFRNAGPVIQDIGGGFVMDDFRLEKTISQHDAESIQPH